MFRAWMLLFAVGCTGTTKDDPTKDDTDTGTASDTDTDTDISLPECDLQEAGFAACLVGGPDPATTKTPYEAKVFGSRGGDVEVVDAGAHLAASCATGWGVGGYPQLLVGDPDVQWLQLEHDDGSLATLGVKADRFDLNQLSVGTELSYDFVSAAFNWSPSIGHLELRDASGTLLLWLAEGGRLEDVAPPAELSLDLGATTCWEASECVGGWQQNALVAEVGGDAAEVTPYATAELGGLHFVHGGFDEQTGPSKCPDAYVANIKVALWAE